MDLILDTAVFLSGSITSIPDGFDEVYITSDVKDEVSMGSPLRVMENMISAGLVVKDPKDREVARSIIEQTGESDLLSNADISIIALALELEEVMVLTDDFRIQNILKSQKIPFGPAGEIGNRTIKDQWEWTYRCRGCGKYFDDPPEDLCIICGSGIKRTRKKIR
jgi:rRNA maturation endonuclease Nob1